MNILLIDDDPGIVNLASSILEFLGHSVVGFTDSGDVAAELSRQPVDLVICDVQMPGMDGLELYDQVVETYGPDAPPFQFITGNTVAAERLRSDSRPGVLGVLNKPFQMEELKKIIYQVEISLEKHPQ